MGNTHDTEIARIEADYIKTKYRSQDDYRWGYTGDRGPETWWVYYPSASGGNQSPIDIVTEDTIIDFEFGFNNNPFRLSYCGTTGAATSGSASASGGGSGHQVETFELVNTGTTARVNVINSKSHISGGPCREYNYKLEQIHLHWGSNDDNGSEHLVNSRSFSAELHLVHWNEDIYDSYDEAVKREDGIAIIAIFVTLNDRKSNEGLRAMVAGLDDVSYRDQSVQLEQDNTLSTRSFLPGDLTKYWSYRGSFTTPPCYETVTWIILQDTIPITRRDLNSFRRLRSYYDTEMRIPTEPPVSLPQSSLPAVVANGYPGDEQVDTATDYDDDGLVRSNCRPVQPRGTRRIRVPPPPSFDSGHHSHRYGLTSSTSAALHRRTVSLLPGRSGSICDVSGSGDDRQQQPFRFQSSSLAARLAPFPPEVVG